MANALKNLSLAYNRIKKLLDTQYSIPILSATGKLKRIVRWHTVFQTVLLFIIGTIFIVPVCLGCADKIYKIKKAF